MSSFQGRLDAAAESTACQILEQGGSALVQAAAYSMVFGPVAKVPLALGTIALFASNYACQWDPEGESTLPGGIDAIVPGSCMETEGCDLQLIRRGGEGGQYTTVRKLISSVASGTYPNGTPKCTTTMVNCDGETYTDDEATEDLWPIKTVVVNGGTCVGDPAPAPEPDYPEYEYREPDSPSGEKGCELTVNVLGWGVNPDGTGAPIYKISPKQEGRSGGGIIGGCNFEPVVYYQPKPSPPGGDGGGDGGDGDPPYTIPFVPGGDDDDPEWLKLLKTALATAGGNLVAGAIKDLLEQPVAGVNYEMPAPCNVDDEGNPLIWTGEIPKQKADLAILDRLDAISAQLTQHLQWKTPICPPERPELEGEFRTISFRSDETSPYGKSRLRKRLRYRSSSGIGLGELVDHWKDFTFTGGPVRVRHVGSSWGTVEVWAASEDEGKRVIFHAAGEAGIDPDQVGRWSTRRSDSSRLGVSLSMSVDTTGGYYWITERDGSDGRPIVAL